MTSWIDGSFVYSTKESWVNAMRSFENGTLKMIGDQVRYPARMEKCTKTVKIHLQAVLVGNISDK